MPPCSTNSVGQLYPHMRYLATAGKSLDSNGIGDEGGLAFADGLAKNASLGHLT